MDFYPRPPRGGRRSAGRPDKYGRAISIHALREEGDLLRAKDLIADQIFLSTPSARRATCSRRSADPQWHISIHALREEGDVELPPTTLVMRIFLSTPSARRATPSRAIRPTRASNFYPRPPRGGRPARLWLMQPSWTNFYPRPPRGGRRGTDTGPRCIHLFLSTPSARRATRHLRPFNALRLHFYPRPPRGGRPSKI